jgi:hypothetical protein
MSELHIQLRPETERLLAEQAKRSGTTVQKLVEEMVEQTTDANAGIVDKNIELKDWLLKWQALTRSVPPISGFVDDGRESIYEGRGE